MIAIGRSRILYNTIRELFKRGERIEAIITAGAYPEYNVNESDFASLAKEINAEFFLTGDLFSAQVTDLIKANGVDIGISVNWRYRIEPAFLGLFKKGILNFHLGNLPDYKGNATVNWSILNGEKFIYANIHKMAAELDSGDIIARSKIQIKNDTYAGDILNKAEVLAPGLFSEALNRIRSNGRYYLKKGSVGGLRCYPRLEEDHQIDWFAPAEEAHRLIRASSRPFSGAFSFLNGEKVVIWKAAIIKPRFKFLAVPGQVVKINKDTGSVYVACSDKFLELREIEVDNNLIAPYLFIKSIRSRFRYK